MTASAEQIGDSSQVSPAADAVRAAGPNSADTLKALEAEARALWGERQEGCARFGADIPMPTLEVPVDLLAELIASRAELLRVLQIVAATLPHMGGSDMATQSLLVDARAAIAKAVL